MKSTFACILFVMIACGDRNPTVKTNEKESVPKSYFPVLDYLLGEIRMIDSLPVGIMKITTTQGKTDSSYIKTDEFDKLAQEFLLPDLKKEIFEKEFNESSFFDQTTQSPTFTYSTKNNKMEVQRVDVLAKQGSSYDKVRSIYIEMFHYAGDTSIIKKLYWRAGKNFLIYTENRIPQKEPVISQIKVVWNSWD